MSSETISLFLNKALQKILKDSSRRHIKLRESIKVALDAIQESPLSTDEGPEWDKLANKLFAPLKCACETRQSKIMGTALDCLQKLMAYGLIRGTAMDEEKPDKKLMDNVIETIGLCFDFPDDNVQLQIIKAFLTAVTSPVCDIHADCLMNSIRSVYNIYLVTKNQVNITTAKATLTQMLNIVFQRMEPASSTSSPVSNNNSTITTPASPYLSSPNIIPNGIPASPNVSATPNIPTSPSISASPNVSAGGPPSLSKLGENSAANSSTMSLKAGTSGESVHFADCFLIFRALCKLSMKEVPEGAGPDAIDMKSKILSLELIFMILESPSPAFRQSEKFINNAIKKYLCVSLLSNGVSQIPKVFKLSLSIFLSLMSHFRENLKAEIGVFFSKIFLWILEHNNSTIQQKWMVLQVLFQICQDPQTLVDIFVNYDCDLEGKDIFERMVYDLSRIAQGGNTVQSEHSATPAAQELKVKTLGLNCLVTIMKSLVDWSKELYEQNEKENMAEEDGHNSGTPATASTANEELEALELMRKQKQFKLVVETGKQKFNVSPKLGIDYLIKAEVIKREPEDVAHFLKTAEGLDKAKIGEYLGEEAPFVVSVMYAFIDSFKFTGMAIDAALRDLLSYFRLPATSTKVDRMMEKFAARYFEDNHGSSFVSADSVYTLAFVIVVLLTDLHNPQVQTKMTKQEWFKMNKGCNGGGDYEYNMLSIIYDNCVAEPLRLRGEKDSHGIDRQKQLRFIRESEELVKSSQATIQEKMKSKSKFFTATHIEHVRPMFELAWCPMLAAFSVLLEDSQDTKVISLCLEGFNHAIRVACIFYMAIERSTFINSLSKFTLLDSLREMRPKNIESIKAVISIALAQGNYLQESWAYVLKCFSLLERLHVIGSGVKVNSLSGSTTHEPDPKKVTRNFTDLTNEFFGTKPSHPQKAVEEVNAEYVAQQIDTSAVDRVYTNSVNLSNSAIVSFVKCLCEVSVEEINSTAPRIFSLQKLVEICYYNMNRLRIVWASIWAISANHFTKIGCHDNTGISMYAIDSLRQLSMKFLEKEELAHYTFQKEFLRPFEYIIHNNPSVQIRELVIRCLSQMIQALGNNIKSGWRSVFLVLATAASDTDASIVEIAFASVDKIMQGYFTIVADTFFVDCVSCVVSFGLNKHYVEICQKSIEWLDFSSTQLYGGKVVALPTPSPEGVIFTNKDKHIALWFPILGGLAKITHHKESAVRASSLQVLFKILNQYGKSFSKELWGVIFQRVILLIFEPAGYSKDSKEIQNPISEDNEWLNSTCTEAFRLLIEFFTDFFDVINFLLYAILDLITACILQENETLSRIASATLLQLAQSNGANMTDEMWSTICSEYSQIFEQNVPHEVVQLQAHVRAPLSSSAPPSAAPPPALALAMSIPPVAISSSKPADEPFLSPSSSADSLTSTPSSSSLKLAPVRIRKVSSTTNTLLLDLTHNIRAKCNVQVLSIRAIHDILTHQYTHLKTTHVVSLIDSLDIAYSHVFKINREPTVQPGLSRMGLQDLFHKLELQSILCYLEALFKLYKESEVDVENRRHQAEVRLISRCENILADFLLNGDNVTSIPIVVEVIKGFNALEDQQFATHLPQFYTTFVDLVLHPNKDVRRALTQLMERIGPTFDIPIDEFPEWLQQNEMDAFLDQPISPKALHTSSGEIYAPSLQVPENEPEPAVTEPEPVPAPSEPEVSPSPEPVDPAELKPLLKTHQFEPSSDTVTDPAEIEPLIDDVESEPPSPAQPSEDDEASEPSEPAETSAEPVTSRTVQSFFKPLEELEKETESPVTEGGEPAQSEPSEFSEPSEQSEPSEFSEQSEQSEPTVTATITEEEVPTEQVDESLVSQTTVITEVEVTSSPSGETTETLIGSQEITETVEPAPPHSLSLPSSAEGSESESGSSSSRDMNDFVMVEWTPDSSSPPAPVPSENSNPPAPTITTTPPPPAEDEDLVEVDMSPSPSFTPSPSNLSPSSSPLTQSAEHQPSDIPPEEDTPPSPPPPSSQEPLPHEHTDVEEEEPLLPHEISQEPPSSSLTSPPETPISPSDTPQEEEEDLL